MINQLETAKQCRKPNEDGTVPAIPDQSTVPQILCPALCNETNSHQTPLVMGESFSYL